MQWRYLSDAGAASLAVVSSLCEAAGLMSSIHYELIALQIIEQGVADYISLRDILLCSPCFRFEKRGGEAGSNSQNYEAP
jgi:hypothetical protein